MEGQKVFELAKHIGITNKKLLSELKTMGIDAKSYMSVLDDKTVGLVINKLAKGKKIKAEEMPQEKEERHCSYKEEAYRTRRRLLRQPFQKKHCLYHSQ